MLFSVGVRDADAGFGLFNRALRAYIVEAATDRKAKNAVARHLKAVGQESRVNVVDAIPAEHLSEKGKKQ